MHYIMSRFPKLDFVKDVAMWFLVYFGWLLCGFSVKMAFKLPKTFLTQ